MASYEISNSIWLEMMLHAAEQWEKERLQCYSKEILFPLLISNLETNKQKITFNSIDNENPIQFGKEHEKELELGLESKVAQ